ncbi:hypothetical protein BDN72DRAFT_834171, partial [Pluteus cervinus]
MALEKDMEEAQNLLFVSKDVFDWLIQILYKTISLFSNNKFAWPPLPFPITKLPKYGPYVQHLLVTAVPEDVLDQYLRYCSNITNFGSQEALSQSQLERLLRLHLSQLKLSEDAFTSLIPPTPVPTHIHHVTHLDIQELHVTFLSHFPSLTHLIVHDDVDDPEVHGEVLRQHPRLKLLIVHIPDFHSGVFPELDRDIVPGLDPRVVHLNYWESDNWQRDAL